VIKVTRLNGKEFVVNAEMIKSIEAAPDTLITLTGGGKLVVREGVDEVVRKAIEYGRAVRAPVGGEE